MLTISEYKSQFVDKQGKAPAILLNKDGETLPIGDVHTVTSINGRLKMKWRVLQPPEQWKSYTHIALLGNGNVQYLQEITPIDFDGKPKNVEVVFHE